MFGHDVAYHAATADVHYRLGDPVLLHVQTKQLTFFTMHPLSLLLPHLVYSEMAQSHDNAIADTILPFLENKRHIELSH